MDLNLLIVTQEGVTWSDWCALAAACEQFHVSTLFAGDHYLSQTDELGMVAHDAWTVIAGLSARTSTLRLGTMVTPVTFRSPAVLANMVATADHISGGRVELGLGSGWMEREHEAFGFPFPRPRVRQQMLAEQLEIVHRLWTEDRVTFTGSYYTLDNAPGRPKPLQDHPPIIVGGMGTPGTTLPAARFADEYNVAWNAHPSEFSGARQNVIEACREVGRDPLTMRFSIALHCVVGETHDEAMDRARSIYALRPREQSFDDWAAAFEEGTRLLGSVDEVAAALLPFAEAGADRLVIMHSLHTDLESIRIIGEQLAPRLAKIRP